MLVICFLFDNSHSDRCEVISHMVLICISLMINDVEHLFMCLYVSFYFLNSVFWCIKVLKFDEVQFIFSVVACALGVIFKKPLSNPRS